jgi:hypothetical protein
VLSCFLRSSFCPIPLLCQRPQCIYQCVWMEPIHGCSSKKLKRKIHFGGAGRFVECIRQVGWVEPVWWPGHVHIPQSDPGATCDPHITVWVDTCRHLATRGTRSSNVQSRYYGNRDYVSWMMDCVLTWDVHWRVYFKMFFLMCYYIGQRYVVEKQLRNKYGRTRL